MRREKVHCTVPIKSKYLNNCLISDKPRTPQFSDQNVNHELDDTEIPSFPKDSESKRLPHLVNFIPYGPIHSSQSKTEEMETVIIRVEISFPPVIIFLIEALFTFLLS